jgi:hypothetical protein
MSAMEKDAANKSADHGGAALDNALAVSRSVKRKAEVTNSVRGGDGHKSAYQLAYDGVTFTPVAVSTGRPGTPHCFFKSSFRVTLPNIVDTADESTTGGTATATATPRLVVSKMRVRQHAAARRSMRTAINLQNCFGIRKLCASDRIHVIT